MATKNDHQPLLEASVGFTYLHLGRNLMSSHSSVHPLLITVGVTNTG